MSGIALWRLWTDRIRISTETETGQLYIRDNEHIRNMKKSLIAAIAIVTILGGCTGNKELPRREGTDDMKAALEAYVREAADKDIDINTIVIVQDGKVTG